VFRIFVDEFGHHDLKSSNDPNERYLGLVGIIMRLQYESTEFTEKLNCLKMEVFGTEDIVLHRRELLRAEPPFGNLKKRSIRNRFNELVLNLISKSTYRVITVVIDKAEHNRRYQVWRFHPYHYCLTVLLERYVQWLWRLDRVGDVMVESRGKKENMQLAKAYRYVYRNGSQYVPTRLFQQRITSRQLKIQSKSSNVSGLQLADLIANPSCRALICERDGVPMTAEFGRQIVETLKRNKYLKNPFNGNVAGWGTKWLP
jgi:hypothetical protein